MTLTQIFKSVKTKLIQILSWISPSDKLKLFFKVVNRRLEAQNLKRDYQGGASPTATPPNSPRDHSHHKNHRPKKTYQTWPSKKKWTRSRKRVSSQTFDCLSEVVLPEFYCEDVSKLSSKQLLEFQIIRSNFTLSEELDKQQFERLLKQLCYFPCFVSTVLFKHFRQPKITEELFLSFWKEQFMLADHKERFFNALKANEVRAITQASLLPFIEEILNDHGGLSFLKQTSLFQEKYIETVLMRIFLSVNRSKTGKITLSEFQRSNLMKVFLEVETEIDINDVSDFFSYIEFYVIISKFQELDTNQDGLLEKEDLLQYANHSLTRRIVTRIFETIWSRKRLTQSTNNLLCFKDFIWFIMSEEDKNSVTAIEYWFGCMDLDGDGYLSEWKLKYFYEEQLQRMQLQNQSLTSHCCEESVPFEQILLEIADMVGICQGDPITMKDIKKSKLSSYFFNMFFNLPKFMAAEQQLACPHSGLSDWKRFAFEEYEISRMEQEENLCRDGDDKYYEEGEDEDEDEEEQLP